MATVCRLGSIGGTAPASFVQTEGAAVCPKLSIDFRAVRQSPLNIITTVICHAFSQNKFTIGNVTSTRNRFGETAAVNKRCECHDLFDELVPFVSAWKWQKETVEHMCAAVTRGEDPCHSVVILQHPPVYTMGAGSSDRFLLFDKGSPPFELHRTERGGEVTFHGPGQLVMYPILNLRNFKTDLHWYLRMLEEVVIRALRSACGIEASRIDGLTGVWVGGAKVAAIGVRVKRWVTYHGLALNVSTNLSPFQNIVPCGIDDRTVGSLHQLLKAGMVQPLEGGQFVTSDPLSKSVGGVEERTDLRSGRKSTSTLTSTTREHGQDTKILLRQVQSSMLTEFADVFQLELVSPTGEGPKPGSQIVIQDPPICGTP